LPYYAKKAVDAGKDFIEVVALGQHVRFGLAEVQAVEHDIDAQIYTRDFELIDQTDMIISYIPQIAPGKAAISSGVERELQHAYEAAKDVYVIWTSESEPSVFIRQTATKVFRNTASAVEFFEQM
jgi:nucleoside 2-deoxyribosyltransferase